MIKLFLKYSKEQEEKTINELKKDLDWIKEHNYKVILPKSFNVSTLAGQSPLAITKAVEEEYDPTDYERLSEEIFSQWDKKVEVLQEKITEIQCRPEDFYNIYMTKYGFVGSYELPNEIMVNITNRTVYQIVDTIIHEIFHLSIEPLIVKYKIPHKQKEKIVNLIVAKNFSIPKKDEPENNAFIEKIFNENYPDIELIIKNIMKTNASELV
jgi:hypothetical protein